MSKTQFEAVQARNEKHLRLYMAEYVSRLSKTYQRRIRELKASPEKSAYLASAMGREDPNVKGLAIAAKNLFYGFPHRGELAEKEYIDLVRQYAPEGIGVN
jgi:hypothetical protein